MTALRNEDQGTKSNNRFVFLLSCVNMLLLVISVNGTPLYDSDLLTMCNYAAGKGFNFQKPFFLFINIV